MDTVYKEAERDAWGRARPVDVVARGDALPFADASQDFVLASHVIEHIPTRSRRCASGCGWRAATCSSSSPPRPHLRPRPPAHAAGRAGRAPRGRAAVRRGPALDGVGGRVLPRALPPARPRPWSTTATRTAAAGTASWWSSTRPRAGAPVRDWPQRRFCGSLGPDGAQRGGSLVRLSGSPAAGVARGDLRGADRARRRRLVGHRSAHGRHGCRAGHGPGGVRLLHHHVGGDDGRDDVPVDRADGRPMSPLQGGRRAKGLFRAAGRDRLLPRRLPPDLGGGGAPRVRGARARSRARRGLFAWDHGGKWAAAAVLAAAALYEFTPLKDACLQRCRGPLGFLTTAWRDGRGRRPAHGLVMAAGAWAAAGR